VEIEHDNAHEDEIRRYGGYDSGVKLRAYEKGGIKEYWIIDPKERKSKPRRPVSHC
jgi:Uma2 family endonuclease